MDFNTNENQKMIADMIQQFGTKTEVERFAGAIETYPTVCSPN